MIVKKVSKDTLKEWLADFSSRGILYGPISDEDRWGKITDLNKMGNSFTTVMSPKEIFLPQDQSMFSLNIKDKTNDVSDNTPKLTEKAVLWGIRPCDAKALSLIHRVFNENDYHDTYFNALWESFIKITIGCIEHLNTCFCTSFEDGSPFGIEGADILATEAEEYWILESITETGDNLVIDLEDATIDEIDDITEIKSKVIESIDNKVPVNIKDKLWNNFDNEAFWAQIGDRCISCGICTFVCPSCYCFDINDEIIDKYARRYRTWDACQFKNFTLEASGHNPRQTQLHRIRQRMMHKFSFFAKKYEDIQLCVGCGRCIRECPVDIDIRQVAMDAELLT